ncbi:hypothetical protein LLE49_20065 [Alicyclobacillus tolerans]|nr:hypothetical protein [Alicyclobacillus tolerans]MCF8567020.1 hypothetical protein [Alicyclobacillus tolerans]
MKRLDDILAILATMGILLICGLFLYGLAAHFIMHQSMSTAILKLFYGRW